MPWPSLAQHWLLEMEKLGDQKSLMHRYMAATPHFSFAIFQFDQMRCLMTQFHVCLVFFGRIEKQLILFLVVIARSVTGFCHGV